MGKWHCVWGYESLDFSAFPIKVENQVQQFVFLNFPEGCAFRIRFQNTWGKDVLPIAKAWISRMKNGKEEDRAAVTVNGQRTMELQPGLTCWSDPIHYSAKTGQEYQITLVFAEKCQVMSACTFLENSMMRVEHFPYGLEDKGVRNILQSEFTQKEPAHQCVIGIDRVSVLTEEHVCTVAAFGDSITHMSRWTAPLSERMLKEYGGQAVLINCGICGNRLLHDASQGSGHGGWFGLGGLSRFEKDLFQNGFTADRIILLQGINDILHPAIGEAAPEECVSSEAIVSALEECAAVAHRHNAKIYICTLMPFNGCKEHWKPWLEEKRCQVNEGLRNSKAFDGLMDFDAWTKDPLDPTRLNPEGESEDRLHPGVEGGRQMAANIDLKLLDF